MKQLTNMYINLIYFFLMHEICEHTIFEPLAKKHLPFFSCFIKKNFPGKIVIAEGVLRASARFYTSCSCQRFSLCSILLLMHHDV
jgi:hypothetical protein